MPELSTVIAADLASYFLKVRAETHKWIDGLTDEQIWRKPYPYGNSAGHLLLHLTGNLSHYIGARVAGTGYVRDRDREFTELEHKPKQQVLQAFDRAIEMVVETIRKQTPEDWLKEYSAEREPDAKERFHIFLQCAGHAYHHVGQLIYLNRELTGGRG